MPPAIAPRAGTLVGLAAPVEVAVAAREREAAMELSAALILLRMEFTAEVAAGPPELVREAMLEEASERSDERSPARELASELRSDRLGMRELTSPPRELASEEAPPSTEETSPRRDERIFWPLAAPTAATATKMVEKRILILFSELVGCKA